MFRYIGSGAVFVGALLIMIIQPLAGVLDVQAQLMLGGILLALGIWIFRPFNIPFSIGGMFLACFALVVGLSPEVVFSGMMQSSVWTLIAALFFGFALQKTGLGYRIALAVLRLFRPSYFTLVLAWAIIGVVLSVLTPSITVRVAIVIPIAVSCCELCGLTPGSKGNSLILLTAFAMALLPGGGWLSGTLTASVIQGAFEVTPGLGGLLNFESWMKVCLFPTALATVLLLVLGLIAFRPDEPLSKAAAQAIKETKLGRVTKNEIVTAAILVASFLMFATSGLHGVSSVAVCLGATFLLFAFGVIAPNEIGTGINWDLIVFIGISLSLGSMCSVTGITDWLAELIVPVLAPIAGKPFLFVAVVTTALFIWHFVDVASYMPTLMLVPAMLPAVQKAYGIDPMVFVPILSLACIAFFMAYQNIWALMGQAISGKRSWTSKHLAVYGTLFFAASLISLLCAVPFWIKAGMFG